jgi:hypothetical protein
VFVLLSVCVCYLMFNLCTLKGHIRGTCQWNIPFAGCIRFSAMPAAPHARRAHNPFRYQCVVPDCNRHFLNRQGLVKHLRIIHPTFRLQHSQPELSSPVASSSLRPSPPQSEPSSNAGPSSSFFGDSHEDPEALARSSPFGNFHQDPEEFAPFSPAFAFPDADWVHASSVGPFSDQGRQRSSASTEPSNHGSDLPAKEFHPSLNGEKYKCSVLCSSNIINRCSV